MLCLDLDQARVGPAGVESAPPLIRCSPRVAGGGRRSSEPARLTESLYSVRGDAFGGRPRRLHRRLIGGLRCEPTGRRSRAPLPRFVWILFWASPGFRALPVPSRPLVAISAVPTPNEVIAPWLMRLWRSQPAIGVRGELGGIPIELSKTSASSSMVLNPTSGPEKGRIRDVAAGAGLPISADVSSWNVAREDLVGRGHRALKPSPSTMSLISDVASRVVL